jgi:Zn-finger nucleic acid-binding protein
MKDVYCHEHDFWYSDDDTCPVCEGIKLTTDRLEKLIEGYRGDEEMGWFIDQIDELLGLNLYSKEHLMTQEDETVSFIKAIEQLEYIAKEHHDSISRVRELARSFEPYGSDTFYGNYVINEINKALDGEK